MTITRSEIITRYLKGESLKSLHRESGVCTSTLRRIARCRQRKGGSDD